MNECHICGTNTDWVCRDCELLVCEDCTVPYNQFTQIDYTLCIKCSECHDIDRAKEFERQELSNKKLLIVKEKRNKLARKRYHSPKQVEKRRKIKLLKELKQIEDSKKLWAIMTDGIPGMRK